MEGKRYDPPGSKAYDNLGDAPDQGTYIVKMEPFVTLCVIVHNQHA